MLDKSPQPIGKDTAAYQALLSKFADRNVRMNTLYTVLDEKGNLVPYRRRPAQQIYADDHWMLDVICKARQLGFSTEIAIDITDCCVFRKNFKAGIIDYRLSDAQLKLQKIKIAYLGLPQAIRNIVQITKDNMDEIWFSNGSSVSVGTTHRGGTLQYLHWSEAGKTAAENPTLAKEIIAGALNTIAPGQQVKIESTAHGTAGAFYDIVMRAQARLQEGRPLSQLDFRLHFFSWWQDPKYRIQASLVSITQELKEYFAELSAKFGIKLDPDQQAFYASKYELLGPDKCREEFPSHISECFFASLEGTWFKREMTKAREERRVGFSIPYDPMYRVNTFWDKGINEKNDQNAIIFHQTDGTRHRIIDYYENAGEGIQHYCAKVLEIGEKRGFIFGKHYAPHDLTHRIWAAGARTSVEIAKDLGIDFEAVPRILMKEDAIEAARKMLNLTWIDSEHCSRLVECLDSYRKTWNKQLAQFTNVPLHNAFSNAADALQTGAVGLKPDSVETADGRYRGQRRHRGSQWTA
jgi:hypothetical protein